MESGDDPQTTEAKNVDVSVPVPPKKKKVEVSFRDKNYRVPDVLKDYFIYKSTIESEEGSNKGNSIKGQCNKCPKEVIIPEGNHFNWKRHLANVHGINIQNIEKNSIKSVKPTSQPLEKFFTIKQPVKRLKQSDPRQNAFLVALVDMVAVDGLPFSFVEGLGFRGLMATVAPQFRIPCRRTLIVMLQESVLRFILPDFVTELQNLPKNSLHISLDIWSTCSRESIIGIKVHFINSNWELVSRTLCYKQMSGSHTGEAIRTIFESVIAERSISMETLGYAMGDNASNICKAFNMEDGVMDDWTVHVKLSSLQELGVRPSDHDETSASATPFEDGSNDDDEDYEDCEEDSEDYQDYENEINVNLDFNLDEEDIQDDIIRLRCLAHTLQLAINDAIKKDEEVSRIVKYLNSVIQTFRNSPLRSDHLFTKISRQLVPIGQTRWNSILFAAERLLEDKMFEAVQKSLLEFNPKSTANKPPPAPPTKHQQLLMRELVSYLKPLQVLTDRFQRNEVMSSRVIISIRKAIFDILQCNPNHLLTFKSTLLGNMEARFAPVLKKESYIIAAILDPRVKTKPFKQILSFGETVTEDEARNLTKLKINEISDMEQQQGELAAPIVPVSRHDDDMDFLNLTSTSSSTDLNQDELSKYLEESTLDKNESPLEYWKTNSSRLPKLAILARIFLAIPTSSGDVERLFSITGNIKRNRRNRLANDKIESILLWRESRGPYLRKFASRRKKCLVKKNETKTVKH